MAASWTGVRGADIKAIYNHREASARELGSYTEALGLGRPAVYTDLHEMLEDPLVDAVWVMTPNYKRVETISAVAEEAKQGRNDLVGVACEKPLARTVDEADEMMRFMEGTGLLHGYLENQVFAPSVTKGKEAVWRHGAANTGRPYLARAAEEHGGPTTAGSGTPGSAAEASSST